MRIRFAALEYQDPAMHASTFVERQLVKRIPSMAALRGLPYILSMKNRELAIRE